MSSSASDRESIVARRSGASARRTVPVRSCIACRTAREKRELVRVVRTPDGRIQIDESGRVAGRGAYLCRDAGCWTRAVERGALGRALAAAVPPELREVLLAGPQTQNATGGAARGQE